MNSRALAAAISSLISELILLLLLLFPASNPLLITPSTTNPRFHENLFPLIHHFISTSEIVSALSLLSLPRKRKRTHVREQDSTEGEFGRTGSGIPRSPDSFKLCFKMTASTFQWLAGILEPLLECRDPIDSHLNLSAESRLGIGLFRLATGAGFPEISSRFRVSEPIAQFCVKQLCRVLCTNFRFWVGFPSPTELESVSTRFESLTGFPNCCGVIACTRFKVSTNCGLKSEESIAAQIVVDSSSRILSIVAGFRGDKPDSRILQSSTLYKDIEDGKLLNSPPVSINDVPVPHYFIGDGGYPLLPWLLIPFAEPVSTSREEKNFNAAHRLMRIPVLKTIASLRNWCVLSRPIEAEFRTAVAYVSACSILHNVLLMREDYSALSDGLDDYSSYDQSSECIPECGSRDDSINRNATAIRIALATRARDS